MAIYMTAQWHCKPGAESKIEQALKSFVASIKQNEPETSVYTALQKVEDKSSFMTYFIFENEAARSFHRSTEWVKRFTEVIYPESQEPVIFTEFSLIASTDDVAGS